MSNRLYIRKLKGEIDVQDTVEKFADQRLLVLLDSAARTPNRSDSRFTILTADPVASCRIDSCQFGDTPFATLREWSQVIPSVDCPDLPFCGGIAGLLGYELGNAFEMLPRSDFRSPFETPDLLAGLFDWAIVWDHDEPATDGEKAVR